MEFMFSSISGIRADRTLGRVVYALGKQVQWQFPHYYGEDQFVSMMGGLYIKMATMNMISDWLEGSGWSDQI